MKLKLLLVEDSPMLIRGLQYTLEQAGYEVVVCMSKHMADERLARMQFDVAVLDVNLPDGSGFDLCRQLKEETDIPVVFLTARDANDGSLYDSLYIVKQGSFIQLVDAGKDIPEKIEFTPNPNNKKDVAFAERIKEYKKKKNIR